MRNVVLYIAVSLDGYIADRGGSVSWIDGDGSDHDHPGSYPAFFETVDTVIFGYKTYRQIVTELAPVVGTMREKRAMCSRIAS